MGTDLGEGVREKGKSTSCLQWGDLCIILKEVGSVAPNWIGGYFLQAQI